MENQENEKDKKHYGPRPPTPAIPSTFMESLISGMQNLQSPTRPSKVCPQKRQGPTVSPQKFVLMPRASSTDKTNDEEDPWADCTKATEAWIATQPMFPSDDDEPMDPNPIMSPRSRAKLPQSQLNEYLLYKPRMPKRIKIEYEDSRAQKGPSGSMIRALNIHVISNKILKMISVQDLKNCRVASKLFNQICTGDLQRRMRINNFQIKFKYHWGFRKFIREYEESDVPVTPKDYLDTLNECLDMRNKNHQFNSFPCTSFAFELGVQDCEDLNTFFTVYGSDVKILALTYEEMEDLNDDYTQFKSLLYVLNKIPNVESLDIPWYYYPDNSQGAENLAKKHVQNELLKLKSLQMTCSAGFDLLLQKILVAAPALEKLINSCPHLLEILVKRKKTHLFKNFEFSPNSANLLILRQFVDTDPALKVIQINTHDALLKRFKRNIVRELLTKILVSGKTSLEEIEMTPLGFFGDEGFLVPVMRNVRSLTLNGYPTDGVMTTTFFPKTMIATQSFPNLKVVKIDDWALSNLEQSVDTLFPLKWFQHPTQRFQTVVNMGLARASSSAVHKRLVELFPGVTHLAVDNIGDAKEIEKIWNTWITTLECVDFKQVFFSFSEYPVLDSIITGISENDCSNFRGRTNIVPDPERWRVKPSIWFLKNLKHLKFHISHVHNWPTEKPSNPFISHISGLFGFSQLPGLQVIFEVSKQAEPAYTKRALEEALPYITIL